MGSEFDQLATEMDAELFSAFAEQEHTVFRPQDGGPEIQVSAVIQRNVAVAGPDGMFVNVQLMADLRQVEVPAPRRGDLLVVGCKRYVLEQHYGGDGFVNRFSLLIQR